MSNLSNEHKQELTEQAISIIKDFLSKLGHEQLTYKITPKSDLANDLAIDSLAKVELFHRLEKHFKIKFIDKNIYATKTVQDVIELTLITKLSPELSAQSKTKLKQAVDLSITQSTLVKYNPENAESLVQVLLARYKQEPQRQHIILNTETNEEVPISYQDLYLGAAKIAQGLKKLNIEPQDTVALMLPTSEEFFYTFMGILLVNAIAVPIYPPFRPDKIEEYVLREAKILSNAQIKVLITFGQAKILSNMLKSHIPSLEAVIDVKDLLNNKPWLTKPNINQDAPVLIQYTSGSTADPKGVLLTNNNLLSNIRAISKAINISSKDVGVSWLPLYHDMGLIGCWLTSFYVGAPIVIMSPLAFLTRPERWLWAIHKYRATLSAAPNFAYELCLKRIEPETIEGLDLSSWRLSFNGAEAINPRTVDEFLAKFKPYGLKSNVMYPVYGLAESSVALIFPPPAREVKYDYINREKFEQDQIAEPVKIKLNPKDYKTMICVGSPLENHFVKITDLENNPLPERHVGLLKFKGPSSMQGYYQNLDATNKTVTDGWINSGDFAYQAGGEYYITGRQKDLIIKAGRNLYPDEIEEVTSKVAGVRKGCVVAFGIHDPKTGTEKLIITAESRETNQKQQQQIIESIMQRVSNELDIQPDEVVILPPRAIPKTSSGKLQRALCKKEYLDQSLTQKRLPMWVQLIKIYLTSVKLNLGKFVSKFWQIIYTSYVYAIIAACLTVSFIPLWVLPASSGRRLIKFFCKLIFKLSGIKLKTNGEKINLNKNYIFVANHASYVDFMVLLSVLPDNTLLVGKKNILNLPLVGSLITKLKHPTVDRYDFAADKHNLNLITNRLQDGYSIGIFPEGTFVKGSGIRQFKLGAFKIAVDTQTPIIPLSISGTRRILAAHNILLKRSDIEVHISKPIASNSKEWDEVIRIQCKARQEIAKFTKEPLIDYV